MLAELGEDIESYSISAMAHQGTRVVRCRMNWKLMSDTFRRRTTSRCCTRRMSLRCSSRTSRCSISSSAATRATSACRESIEKLRDLPQEKWDLIPHTTILMNLFPQHDPRDAIRPRRGSAESFPPRALRGRERRDLVSCTRPVTKMVAHDGPSSRRRRRQDFHAGQGIRHCFRIRRSPKGDGYGRYENALEHGTTFPIRRSAGRTLNGNAQTRDRRMPLRRDTIPSVCGASRRALLSLPDVPARVRKCICDVLVRFPLDKFLWVRGRPKMYQSSKIARRRFCADAARRSSSATSIATPESEFRSTASTIRKLAPKRLVGA